MSLSMKNKVSSLKFIFRGKTTKKKKNLMNFISSLSTSYLLKHKNNNNMLLSLNIFRSIQGGQSPSKVSSKLKTRNHYKGSNLDALLTITVNDLGNYGCYLDCTDIMSFPRSIEASVILIKRRPLNSTTAFLLGSAIFFEIATVFLLGGLLLFFICKCMIALHTGREDSDNSKNNPREELLGNHKEKNALNFSGISTPGSLQRGHSLSTPVSLSRRHSNFRQRSRQRIKLEESELPPSYASFGDNLQLNPPYIEMQKQHQSD